MQIKNARSALISNYEVLKLLEESQELQKQIQKNDPSVEYPESLRTVQFEVIDFFLKHACFWTYCLRVVDRIFEGNTCKYTITRTNR
jgi:hypothetical protein